MFKPTCLVLQGIIEEGSCYSQRGDADATYTYLKSFEFVFILHLIKEIMGRTDMLSQALQKKSQDILNAIELVSATKESLNDFRNNNWLCLLEEVKVFCEKHEIEMPDMHAPYKCGRYRPRRQDNHVTFEHHYKADLFIYILDKQLQELNNRFGDNAIELLTLASSLVPSNGSHAFNVDEICLHVEKYYPEDFTEQERLHLRYQLEMFKVEMPKNQIRSGVSSIAQLCTSLEKTKKSKTYHLLSRLIQLLLTLPVSTATTER